MPRPQDDVAWGSGSSGRERPLPGRSERAGLLNARTLLLVGGFALAVAATLAVFLTDNRQYLRIAVVAVAWAFVLAAFAAGRRGSDRATAAAREAQLRQAYALELEREVAARREFELDLEHDLRREGEDAMRRELDALRSEISSLAALRDEVARVSDLRRDLAGLSALREDVARVAALRDDLAALPALRTDLARLAELRSDLGQLSELRADMGRLRAELTEQLSSEMLVERIVMRTQGGRQVADQGRSDVHGRPLDESGSWSDDAPPRELTGGWPAIRLDDPWAPRRAEPVRTDRSSPPLWIGPVTSSFSDAGSPPPPAGPAPTDRPRSVEREDAPAERSTAWPTSTPAATRARHSDEQADGSRVAAPDATTESPLEWLAARSLVDAVPPPVLSPPSTPSAQAPLTPSTALRPSVAPRPSARPQPTPPAGAGRPLPDLPPLRRRSDDPGAESTAERPLVTAGAVPAASIDTGPVGRPAPDVDGEGNRLAEILAENGVSPSTGGRRRRRYREDGEPDDVLARILSGG
jgi:Domain of unknown function (DUF6779)